MSTIARALLLLFVFAIPWEYSLDLGEPFGNLARIAGILVLLAVVPALLQSGQVRRPDAISVGALVYFLWFCLSCFWTVDSAASLYRLRANFQELMIVWLIGQLAATPRDLRNLVRAFVAGSAMLALLTLVAFRSMEATAEGQIRFAASGQDPNDLARFLDLAFPFAALLLHSEKHWLARLLALSFLFAGPFAVVLTASRGGTVAAGIALAGSALLLVRGNPRRLFALGCGVLVGAVALWLMIPEETFARLMTITEQLHGGDLNQRVNIWSAGWHAFVHAPLIGYGAGSFVAAARLAPIDTAHNTALSLAVTGGLCALLIAAAIVALAIRAAWRTSGPLRIALLTALLVWCVTSLTATVEENRTTWLLFGLVAFAGRLAWSDPAHLAESFSGANERGDDTSRWIAAQPESVI